nr:immunoglobulin heavy chain junction region [Macaca mulatta]MOY21504.1 immunoglobulin heavy chain junction region [Macaca mulatta]MOY21624.1 immunoglobulin heavy chain junction region [Macaca mulatta]MOY21893.1 immunoglobulin heavy chain junction region [Macaca mulatta]MOY22074.1 immunoglobulin heavy chain junction region [Macaca mulatta]
CIRGNIAAAGIDYW